MEQKQSSAVVGFPSLLTPVQAAEALGIKPATLEADRVQNRLGIPYIKLGRLVRYRASDLNAFVEARVRRAAA